MNQTPIWKYVLLLALVIVSLVYALPNLYPDDPAVQITGSTATVKLTSSLVDQVESILAERQVAVKSIEQAENSLLVRLADNATQLRAKDVLQAELGGDFLAALNLAATTPEWLKAVGAGPLKLGLDLSGGVHFLMEVDMEVALEQRMEAYRDEVKTLLRENRLRYSDLKYLGDDGLTVRLRNLDSLESATALLKQNMLNDFQWSMDEDTLTLEMVLQPMERKAIQDYAISQNLTTLRNRVNELGVAEPLVQRQGANRIVVQLPGVQDTGLAKRVLGRTATLEFRLQNYRQESSALSSGRVPSDSEVFPFTQEGRDVLLYKSVMVTGDQVVDAQSGYDENGRPQVNITLNNQGGKQMFRVTSDHIKEPMAVLFVEHKSRLVPGATSEADPVRETFVEKRVINVATIQAALGNRFRITGLDSPAESSELALLLRAGALAAPMYFVEERTVGPSLGQANIDAGFSSIVLGFVLVMLFMVVYYRLFGLFANIALAVNLIIIVAVMSLIPGAALTLPGMAGIVLTVGMAVDANVLIFARIREELKAGSAPHQAIQAGYDRAFVTIVDANVTTLIVALILFAAGNGPVKGFSVTLAIGIITSMFTAIVLTRALVNAVYGGRKLERLAI